MAESGLNIVAFKKISIRYVIVTVAVIGILQALAWTILSLISILYYNNVIQITDDTYQQDYSYWIYKIYLQNGIKIIDFIIDPVSFNIFMYFYMVLSFVWLIISCYILWAMVRDKWDYTKCSLVSWASITLAVAALDIILMSLIASDINTAKGLFKPMSTPITTTTMFSTTSISTDSTMFSSITPSIPPYTESTTIPTFETTSTTTIPETTPETTTITTITTTTEPSTTPIITTTTEPSTITTITTTTEPSTTTTEPSSTPIITTTTEPSTITTITTTTEPSTTTTEPSTITTITTTTEPSTTTTQPSTTITDPSTTTTEPSSTPIITTTTEPSTITTITTTTEPSTTTTEPSSTPIITTTTEPSTITTITTTTEPSTTTTQPSTTITDPSTTTTGPSTTSSTTLPSEFLAVGNNNVEMGNFLLLELNEEWFTQFMIVYPNQVTTFNTAMSIVMSIAARGYVLWILNVVFALIFIFMVHQMKKQEKRSMLPIIDAYAMGQRPFTLYDATDIGPGNWNNGFEPDQNIIFRPKGNPMSKNTPNIDDSTPQNFDMFQPYVTPGRSPTSRPVSNPTRPVASTSGAVGRPARSDYYPKPLEITQGGQRLAKIGKSTPGRRTPPQRIPSPQVPGMPYIPPPDYTPPGSPSTRPRSVLRPRSNYVL